MIVMDAKVRMNEMTSSCHQNLEPRTSRHVLTLKLTEWNQLQWNLKRSEREAAALEAALAKRQAMKQRSEHMIKKWQATGGVGLNNSRQTQLDARNATVSRIKADRENKLQEIRRERKEERRKYLNVSARLMFFTNDSVKALNKALVFSEILREREEQLKFNVKLKAIEDAREAAYAAKLLKNAKEFDIEIENERTRSEIVSKEYRCTILEQLRQEKEKIVLTKEIKKKLEVEENDKFNKEVELASVCERKTREKQRADLRKTVLANLEDSRNFKEMKRVEDEGENKIISVYSAAKQQIAKQCKAREKEVQEQVVRRRQEIVDKLVAEQKVRRDNENEIIRKAIEKRTADDEKALLEKELYKKKLVDEILEDHRDHVEAEEQRRTKEKESNNWQLLQRYKTEDVSNEFVKQRQRNQKAVMASMRAELEQQMVAKKAQLVRHREEDIQAFDMYKAQLKAEENAFFNYADALLEDSRKKGRPLVPIERALVQYKIHHSLVPKKKPNPSMMSAIPFGRAYVPNMQINNGSK